MGNAYRFALKGLTCHEETGENSASDEPYVVVFAVDVIRPDGADLVRDLPQFIQDAIAGLIPSTSTTLYGPFENTDAGESKFNVVFTGQEIHRGRAFWHRPAQHADDLMFMVGLVENDEANTSNVRLLVHTTLTAQLASASPEPGWCTSSPPATTAASTRAIGWGTTGAPGVPSGRGRSSPRPPP